MSRFITPATTTLTLASGETLTVRRRLTYGDSRARLSRSTHYVDGVGWRPTLEGGLATVTAYLLDWTLTDDAGAVVPIRGLAVPDLERILDNLSTADFHDIRQAIESHEEAMTAERDQQKKTAGGTPS